MTTKEKMNHVLRLTFGIVHAIFITLVGFGLALLFPSLTTFMFGLVGFIVLPLFSLIMGFLCNLCILYVTQNIYSVREAMKTAWYPAAGIFAISLFVMPLEYIQPAYFGDVNLMFGLSLIGNAIATALLQVYAARLLRAQSEDSSPT
jgi:hypothetical protein